MYVNNGGFLIKIYSWTLLRIFMIYDGADLVFIAVISQALINK